MSRDSVIVIKRKKGWGILVVVLTTFGFTMIIILCLIGLFSNNSLFEKLGALFFIAFSIFGFWAGRTAIAKVLSDNPEFEINEKEFLIYDNPYYESISLKDVLDCNFYRGRKTDYIGFSLRPDSKVRDNVNFVTEIVHDIHKGNSKMVFLSLDFADIEPKELIGIVNKKLLNFKK